MYISTSYQFYQFLIKNDNVDCDDKKKDPDVSKYDDSDDGGVDRNKNNDNNNVDDGDNIDDDDDDNDVSLWSEKRFDDENPLTKE